jgi:hypothetical protein
MVPHRPEVVISGKKRQFWLSELSFLIVANDIPKASSNCYAVPIVKKVQRVIVCGNSVALAGIETSLGMDDDCEVMGHAMPAAVDELRELNPDVVIFELDAVQHELIYTLSKELPGLLMIGIDLETNRVVLWTQQQAEGWTSQDLARVIRHTGKTGSLKEPKQGKGRNEVPGGNKGP